MIVTNPASTLAGVIRCVRDIFAAMPSQLALPPEQRVTVTIGKRPGSFEGAPPRVHFRPDERGTWGDPPAGLGGKGFVAGAQQGCSVYVWGPPADDGDDFKAYDGADSLIDDVWNALERAARGRVVPASFGDASKADEEYYGQSYVFRFAYERGVQKNAEIAALPADSIGREKAFRRSGRFIVSTATPWLISASRSSVPVSKVVMAALRSGWRT